jgi:sialic acid synthase SpsE
MTTYEKPEINIGSRKIGNEHPPFVIAEIGINHDGDMNKAIQMIVDASNQGAECVKFQCHILEDEMSKHAKGVVPGNADVSIYEIMEKNTFTLEQTKYLKNLTESLGMIYMSTPFSRAAADRLESLGVLAYKIGSGECNNYPLIEHIASFGKPVILSTGMNSIDSIQPAVKIFRKYKIPYVLLHCTSMYPTPYDKVRLGALEILQDNFPDAVLGLSDHSLGIYTCLGAVPLGASVLEKHYTSHKSWSGPDIPISIDPDELLHLIKGSKAIHQSLGGTKEILPEEQVTIDFAYASVVSISEIKKGDVFGYDNLWVKRPGTGQILAKDLTSLLGKVASRDIATDSQINWDDIL